MISAADARQRVQENLEGFPPAVIAAYLDFAETGDLARLDDVILGVLQFYLAKPPSAPLATLPGSTKLVQDLGCDSLTMADMVFRAEGLFAIKLIDDELARIVTLDDLRAYFRRQFVRSGGAA